VEQSHHRRGPAGRRQAPHRAFRHHAPAGALVMLDRGAALWRICTQLTDLEAEFRSSPNLGCARSIAAADGRYKAHLWISVLAYQPASMRRVRARRRARSR
jgi:hypothetical protein